MDRKTMLLEMRQEGTLKGKKPAFVFLKLNCGKIYNEGTADFIMSIKDNILYFQRLSTFFKVLQPKKDFQVNVRRFCEYDFRRSKYYATLTLFDKQGFYLEIHYQTGTKDSYKTEDSIARMIKEFEEMGIVKTKGVQIPDEPDDDEAEELD